MSKSTPVQPRPAWWNPGWSWKVWAMVAFLLVPTLGFAFWVLAQAGGQTTIDAATLTLARKNAAGPVTAITGTEHTIYHANNPLPEAKAPREDGRLTLVWFTSGTCKECEAQVFVHAAVAEYRDSLVFVEKDAGRDAGADRLGVKDVPVFVWLDAEGGEIGRFSAVPDEAALKAELLEVLASE